MKIEIKNIQYSELLSEETNAFAATLYIEGRKAGTASNTGHGGPTGYRADDEKGKKLIERAEAWCKTLPPDKFRSEGKDYSFEMNLESHIDKLLDKWLDERDLKRFQTRIKKEMERGVVVGIPNESYSLWRFKMPLANYLKNASGLQVIKRALVNEILPTLREGRIILNTNIPQKLLEESGLKKNQYTEPVSGKDAIQQNESKLPRKGRKL
ncbi:hypothetical protein J7E50_17960 [Pedobacter sp. ISL-68]|uniref:hypothetical protein n=1 Tax=unclassified Pedobacter TaxID=2628915 RepID=UPI001BE97D21|nr:MULTISPECIES: hypothetical protein [unclassified Pedobacter]MBT2559809.1 hypothetical protein [Pedobacter sp. ISL-64]MBT2592114.1 hypothetical protein [Pedobacter sp. ISL-68]